MKRIKMLIFDIDGVITDGKKYINADGMESKAVQTKDLDALQMYKDIGLLLGCISGENVELRHYIANLKLIDFVAIGCKKKVEALEKIKRIYHLTPEELCYIGDGKYDIPILEEVGLAVCPCDAIKEVKRVSDIILSSRGGEGCLAELYTYIAEFSNRQLERTVSGEKLNETIVTRMKEHSIVLDAIAHDTSLLQNIHRAVQIIISCYRESGTLFLCGNGGSAADAQHLAAELVGKFYLERKALAAEALSTNSSILTALANDYDYRTIFARQLEAKARSGDVLIGITTSGTSENICYAFQKAAEIGVQTILMTGDIPEYLPIWGPSDCVLAVPSKNTPRIQEMHILIGHLICELVERNWATY